MNRFRESGAAGLVNLRRGRPGNHRLPESLKLRVLSLLHDHYSDFINPDTGPAERALLIIHEHYADFGPTLACENLAELHSLYLTIETLRNLMIQTSL